MLHQDSVQQCLFETFVKQWHDVLAFIVIADQGLAGENAEVDVVCWNIGTDVSQRPQLNKCNVFPLMKHSLVE